jgi:ribosomal protein S6
MAIIAGQAVRGKNFWNRPDLLEDINDILESNGHALLVAPRRVGKTSLMYKILDDKKEEYIVLYIDFEAQHSCNAFWKKLFSELMNEEFISTLKNKAKSFYSKIASIRLSEAGVDGVKFGESKSIDYAQAFVNLLKSNKGDKKIIIMLDEFSQAIENIIKNEGKEKAIELLEQHREIRQNHKLSENTFFIYAGSIGLESVVSNINSSKLINDLSNISVLPLGNEDAKAFTIHLCKTNNIEIQEETIFYMLEKIEYFIPFYIQLITQEIKRLYRKVDIIDNSVIDEAIRKVLEHKKEFAHWEERLSVFNKNNKSFAREILSLISTDKTSDLNTLINIATRHSLNEKEAKEIIHILKYDGYINNSDDIKLYRFNSPILRIWWYENVAN